MLPTPDRVSSVSRNSLAVRPGRPLLLSQRSNATLTLESLEAYSRQPRKVAATANRSADVHSRSTSTGVARLAQRDIPPSHAPPAIGLPSLPRRTSLPTLDTEDLPGSDSVHPDTGDDTTAIDNYTVEAKPQRKAPASGPQHPKIHLPSPKSPVLNAASASPSHQGKLVVEQTQSRSVFDHSPPPSRAVSPANDASSIAPVSSFKRFWRRPSTDRSVSKPQVRQEIRKSPSRVSSIKASESESETRRKEFTVGPSSTFLQRFKALNSTPQSASADFHKSDTYTPYPHRLERLPKLHWESDDQRDRTSDHTISEFAADQGSGISQYEAAPTSRPPSVRSRTISDSAEASSPQEESVWSTSHTSVGSYRAPISRQAIEETSHEASYDRAPSKESGLEVDPRCQSVARTLSSRSSRQSGSDVPPLRRLSAISQPQPPPQPLGRILGLRASEYEPELPVAMLGKTSTNEMTASAKGSSWRTRFGNKKSGGEDSAPSSASAATYHTTRDRDRGTEHEAGGRRGERHSDRDMAVQYSAHQRQPNDDAKLSSTLSGLDARSLAILTLQESQRSTGGHPQGHKRSVRSDMAASSNASSKLERMTGEHGIASAHHGRSTYDTSSLNSTHHTGGRSYTESDMGQQDDASCPVCLELLCFRLAGEKKHVVPVCGHALHHACFAAVYGSPEAVLAAQSSQNGVKASSPGMCGVCRRLIVLTDGKRSTKVSKVAGMMGVEPPPDAEDDGDGSDADVLTHDDSLDDGSMSARSRKKSPSQVERRHFLDGGRPSTMDLDADRLSPGQLQRPSRSMVLPEIKIRPEYDTVYLRNHPGARLNKADTEVKAAPKNVVCVISIDIPSRRSVPLFDRNETERGTEKSSVQAQDSAARACAQEDDETDGHDDDAVTAAAAAVTNGVTYPRDSHFEVRTLSPVEKAQEQRRESETADVEQSATTEDESYHSDVKDDDNEGFSFGATPKGFSFGATKAADGSQEYEHIITDLRHRIVDWKGHTIERFGTLLLHEYLGVRQDNVVRDFFVYLFKEALLCVSEERRKEKSFTRLISAADRSQNSDEQTLSGSGSSVRKSKVPLKLKGRIWLRHIRHCTEMEIDGKPCVSIKLDDESLDRFVLCFKDSSLRGTWRAKLTMRLQDIASAKKQRQNGKVPQRREEAHPAVDSSERSEVSTPQPLPTRADVIKREVATKQADNTVEPSGLTRLAPETVQALANTSKVNNSSAVKARELAQTNVQKKDSPAPAPTDFASPLSSLPRHQQWSASGGLDPSAPVPQLTDHTAIDLVIIVSVPTASNPSRSGLPSSTMSSSAALKLRLIRSTLDFVIANMGPRDRIALVSYQVGEKGLVRRTALLNSAKSGSRAKLDQFISSTGQTWQGPEDDPFREDVDDLGGRGDRTDTVSAVNVGFDIVLQRKSKNPVTAMLLINDTTDAPKRAQMDLIMARAEAANVPVHCFGFGKGHDPSSLWLVSNHTRGSYTFVKEWYQLRECVAGCIGALMSVALTNVRLHISMPADNHFRVRKVSGCTGAVISSSGKDVDLELGEMRFGEGRELFVELELDVSGHISQLEAQHKRSQVSALAQQYERGSATDDFMQRLGLQGLGVSPVDGMGGTRRVVRRANSVSRQCDFVDDTVDEQWDGQARKNDAGSDDDAEAAQHTTTGYVDEVAVMEVQCGCRDPALGTLISRLPDCGMLTVEIDTTSRDPSASSNSNSPSLATALTDPVVTRRRLEILVSDMITRCLLLVSRQKHAQALTLLLETRRIVDTVRQGISQAQSARVGRAGEQTLASANSASNVGAPTDWSAPFNAATTQYARASKAQRQREELYKHAVASLTGILEDLDVLLDGLESGKTVAFERSERNFGAQQAMVLRDQKAWTSRTDTEWQFFSKVDNGPVFAALAAHCASEFSR